MRVHKKKWCWIILGNDRGLQNVSLERRTKYDMHAEIQVKHSVQIDRLGKDTFKIAKGNNGRAEAKNKTEYRSNISGAGTGNAFGRGTNDPQGVEEAGLRDMGHFTDDNVVEDLEDDL